MKMKELFDRGEFVVSAEVGPPKGIHVDELVEEAKTYLKDVHAVNVTDNQSSVMRLGSLAMCKVLKDAGMDPIFQLACRDRNRIALESDLLSAAIIGFDNILCLTFYHTMKFMEKANLFGKPVQVGIIIRKSVGMVRFMNNNVAGIHVPDEMIEELKADKEKTKAGITGVEIAARIIKECKPYCQGVHIMALGWESKIPDLLKLAEI